MTHPLFRKTLAAGLCLLLAAALPVAAQQEARKVPAGPDYSEGKRNPLTVYFPMRVDKPVLVNTPRIEQLVREGKLHLSLEETVSIALENNLDIGVQRYAPQISAADLLRTKAGIGTPAGSFDPTLTNTSSWERRTIPINNPFLAGTGQLLNSITNYSTQSNFQLTQGFHTGTAYSITWNNSRSSTSNPGTFLNPSTSSSLFFGFQQPLLEGFGFLPNTRFIRIARNNKKIADLTFENQVILTVSAVQNLYWDLVFAREDVKVKERSVQLAEKLYTDNKRQVEIGTLAPIEVVRAEAEVARTRQDLIVAQTFLLQQQTLLKNALTKNIMDPALAGVDIVPTDAITKPPVIENVPLTDAVREAWERRPDVRQSRIDLENRNINVRATKNSLLPSLNVSGQFGGQAIAGQLTQRTTTPTGAFTSTGVPIVDANGNPLTIGGVPAFSATAVTTTTTTVLQGGYSDTLELLRKFQFPTYGIQFTLSIPILNRAAQADNIRAQLEQHQAETSFQRLQNSVVVEVRNAQIALEQNRARVEAAQKNRELAERTLDAEQKKYLLGASTIFFVIQAQRDLASAQSAEVSALVILTKSKVEYERALGRTLEVNRINIADALREDVNRFPFGSPAPDPRFSLAVEKPKF
jgi:outer membrane protein TolC